MSPRLGGGTIGAVRPADSPGEAGLWRAVDRLIDRASSEDDLRSHRLEVLAARRFRAVGRAVPSDFVAHERAAALSLLTAPLLLARVRAACDLPMIVIKGPEVASRYPDPSLRGFSDVDLLVRDATEAQQALIRAGFEEIGDPELYVGIHHLRPLHWPGLPLFVEVHSEPKWLDGRPSPTMDELLEAAEPGVIADGFLALPPAHHAVLLAAHSWAHDPLRCLRDLVDTVAVAEAAETADVDAVARAWGVERLWSVTRQAGEAVFRNGRRPIPLRVWARNLPGVHERTVLENHLRRWLSDFSVLPPLAALRRTPATFLAELQPASGETRTAKLVRSARALRNAFGPRS